MQAVKLVKRRSPGYHKGRELQAYGSEFDTQGFVDAIEKNINDGVLTQDSLVLGKNLTIGFQINSPVRHDEKTDKVHFSAPSLSVWVRATSTSPNSAGIVPMLVETAQAPIVTFDTGNPSEEISYR